MSVTLALRSVPAEFRGKARQVCDAILTEVFHAIQAERPF
jgi:hypothetical protein